jgi:hypothetical protein
MRTEEAQASGTLLLMQVMIDYLSAYGHCDQPYVVASVPYLNLEARSVPSFWMTVFASVVLVATRVQIIEITAPCVTNHDAIAT